MVTPPGVPDSTVKDMKPSFKSQYGDRWKKVLYATLWKNKESYQKEETINEKHPQECPCGSGEYPEAVHDARGIFVAYTCPKCEKEKLKGYRKEIFTNPNYSHDEPIEADEETINEISKKLASRYTGIAHWQVANRVVPDKQAVNRIMGIEKAISKIKGDKRFAVVPATGGKLGAKVKYPFAGEKYTNEETIIEDRDDDIIRGMENYAKGNVRANWMKGYEKPGPEFQKLIDDQKAALAKRRKDQAEADRNLKNYQTGNVRANYRSEETQLDEAKKLNLVALKRQYSRNENNNYHIENAVMLAKHFGSHEEHGKGLDILAKHKKLGYLPDEGMDYEYQMNQKYYPKLHGRNEETELNEAKKGWNDKGEDYLDFSDEEQQGLQQAIKKHKRDNYSDALKAKFDRIATPGKRGPTDPALLDIIHKFAVRRQELAKKIRKYDEETINEKRDPDWEAIDPKDERIGDEGHKPKKKKQLKEIIHLDEISVFALDRFHKAADKEIDRLTGKETEYKNKGWTRKAHAVSDRIIKHQVYGTERADDMIKKKTGSYNPSVIHKIANKIHDIELGKNLKKEAAREQADKNERFKKAQFKETVDEHIVKHGSGFRLLSHKGKNLGTFKSKAAAAKHEGEVEYFKHHKEETQLDEAKKGKSWNPPEVQAKAAKEKKEQKMFASAKREINRLKRQGK